MINFKEFNVDEARKNPSLNPRVPAYNQIIEKGYDTEEYFFTYTNVKKVGINPTSQHETPNGIYTFPAKEILKMVHGNMKNVPYVEKAPYIYILKKRGKGILDPIESYSQSDYTKDMRKIYKIITGTKKGSLPMNDQGKKDVRELMFDAQADAKLVTPIGWLWNVTRELSRDSQIASHMGWGGVRDSHGKDWYSDEITKEYDEYKKIYRKRKDKGKRKGKKRIWGGVGYNAQGWNNLLRRLGYEGFVDRNGTGLIHSNEPIQAVFMSTKAFTVVDMIENKSYDVLNRQSEIEEGIKILEKKYNTVSIVGDMTTDQLKRFRRIVDGDIRGCNIDYYDRKFFISGDGEISDFTFEGDDIRLNNITIDSGDFYHMKYIVDCYISGGFFNNCEINSCEIVKGSFTECDFPNIKVINNSNLDLCKIMDQVVFNCNLDQCRVIDSSIGSGCNVNNTFIRGHKSKIIIDSDNLYTKCELSIVIILKGLFDKCIISNSEIKGGNFSEGTIDNSVIKDGEFRDVKIRMTDVQGGKKV